MLRKTRRAERGELDEPSVVQTPRARLLGGTPNALIGVLYYPVMGAGIWAALAPWAAAMFLAAACFAAAVSAVLAYSLLLVTRMPCRYCWTAHAINWLLAVLNLWCFLKISYWR